MFFALINLFSLSRGFDWQTFEWFWRNIICRRNGWRWNSYCRKEDCKRGWACEWLIGSVKDQITWCNKDILFLLSCFLAIPLHSIGNELKVLFSDNWSISYYDSWTRGKKNHYLVRELSIRYFVWLILNVPWVHLLTG